MIGLLLSAALWWSPPPDMPKRAYPLVLVLVSEAVRAGEPPDSIPWLAAQVDAESAWDPNARSPYAEGLAQFTAATAGDAANWCEGGSDFADWRVPGWQLRCQIAYMRWLGRYTKGAATVRDSWLMRFHAYNAGPGWTLRERVGDRYQPDIWPCRRRADACHETRTYIARIQRLRRHYGGT